MNIGCPKVLLERLFFAIEFSSVGHHVNEGALISAQISSRIPLHKIECGWSLISALSSGRWVETD
jgi:hypothetical protein